MTPTTNQKRSMLSAWWRTFIQGLKSHAPRHAGVPLQAPGRATRPLPAQEVPVTTLTPEQLMQTAMNDAMALTENTEDGLERVLFEGLVIVCYAVPFILSWLVGVWIGDGLADVMKVAPDARFLYQTISTILEMTLSIAVITCARAIKRTRSDPSAIPLMIVSLIWFLALGLGSAVTQWVVMTRGYDVVPSAVAVVAAVRGIGPLLGDVICATYIALHGYKSLKRRIAQLEERAEAASKIYTRQVAIVEQSNRLQRENEDRERERVRRDRSEEMINRIQEIQSTGAIDTLQALLSERSQSGNNRNGRI